MSQALYRKYRSTSFDELVGQEHVTELLKSAVKNGNFSHAYLFTGQRGTGKTSAARILAYAINELPYDADAGHLDIIEIDAASNRRIDDIRDLREKVFIAPVSAKYKVYIIDEVHMLTGESFNALLKTIEEPPAHAVFILATTELHKVPATIISRTQRFHFRPVALDKVVEHLKMIAKKEKIDIDDEALKLIAEHGGGSFRDSISLLDQLGSMEGKVTADTVESILGRARSRDIATILQLVRDEKQAELHALLTDMLAQGISPVTLSEQLVTALLHSSDSGIKSYELSEKLMAVPKAHFPQLLLLNTLLGFVARVDDGRWTMDNGKNKSESKRTTTDENNGRQPADSRKSKAASKRVAPGGAAPASGKVSDFSEGGADQETGPSAKATLHNISKESERSDLSDSGTGSYDGSGEGSEEKDGEGEQAQNGGSGEKKEASSRKNNVEGESFQGGTLEQNGHGGKSEFNWEAVLAATKKTNPALHSVLSRADVRLDDDTLHLAFQYGLHRKKLEQAQYRTQLARTIKDVCNIAPEIVIEDKNAVAAEKDDHASKVADLMGGGERVRV